MKERLIKETEYTEPKEPIVKIEENKVEEKGELPVDEKGVPKTFPKGGVAYNIPGKISIKIDCEGKNYCNQVISSAQHGVVFGIDPKLFVDKKDPIYVLFDPITGAIKELGSVKNLSK